MNLRKIVKKVEYHARRARVGALAVPRAVPWLRRGLHLPPNGVIDPLDAGGGDGIRLTLLDPKESFARPMPSTADASGINEFFAVRRTEECSPSYVAEMAGGSVWGFRNGAVFSPDGRFMPVFSRDPRGPHLHTVRSRIWLPAPRFLTGRTLYLVTPEATDNYHHWVVDLLPRIGLVTRAGFALADFDNVVVNHSNRRYQTDSLAAFGIGPERIIRADESLHLRAEMLVVPSLKSHNQCLPQADITCLRRQFLGTSPRPKPSRRVYISRRSASFRRLRNEAELLPLLAEHRFEVVSLGDLSMPEQALLFADAECILGVSGAGFANLVFASPSTKVIELAPPQWLSVYHWMISARLGLDHTVLLGEGPAWSGRPEITGRTCDVTLSVKQLSYTLGRHPERAIA
jgi:capsular polysaccharide biosynthesis protein